MKKIYLIIISLFLFHNSYAQLKESSIKLYQTTIDFKNDSIWNIDAIALIKNESESYIQIKKIIDAKTRKNIKRGISAWAIEYNGEKYLNLGYSRDLNNWGIYMKFDIIGKYSAIIIDDKTPNSIKNGNGYYGGGLTGVLINESVKWNKNWKDENNEKKKILFIDTNNSSEYKNVSRNAFCSLADYLTRDKLKEISNEKFPNIDIKDVPFEKVIEIINSLNQ